MHVAGGTAARRAKRKEKEEQRIASQCLALLFSSSGLDTCTPSCDLSSSDTLLPTPILDRPREDGLVGLAQLDGADQRARAQLRK